jgi:YtkA-like
MCNIVSGLVSLSSASMGLRFAPTLLVAMATALIAWPGSAATRADLGPGPDHVTVNRQGMALRVSVNPNRAQRWNTVELTLRRSGKPLRGARVWLRFAMPAMSMGVQRFGLKETRRGVYRYAGPAISMPGEWVLTFEVHPPRGHAVTVAVHDHVGR